MYLYRMVECRWLRNGVGGWISCGAYCRKLGGKIWGVLLGMGRSSGHGEKWLDPWYILKVKPTIFADEF